MLETRQNNQVVSSLLKLQQICTDNRGTQCLSQRATSRAEKFCQAPYLSSAYTACLVKPAHNVTSKELGFSERSTASIFALLNRFVKILAKKKKLCIIYNFYTTFYYLKIIRGKQTLFKKETDDPVANGIASVLKYIVPVRTLLMTSIIKNT